MTVIKIAQVADLPLYSIQDYSFVLGLGMGTLILEDILLYFIRDQRTVLDKLMGCYGLIFRFWTFSQLMVCEMSIFKSDIMLADYP